MFPHPDRRRHIRTRADLEVELARMSLVLAHAPASRLASTRQWFDEAVEGLIDRAVSGERDYLRQRIQDMLAAFFPEQRAFSGKAVQAGPGVFLH
ncbi:MAG: hypothetical protein EPO46_08910 [Lysobacter sp.]|nr:MAG: hypothetical protein EPO46_08910 [Lysobacter sp.]